MLTNILPASPLATQIQAALDPEILDVYFVGHNARDFIYGFPKTEKVYKFILSQDGVMSNALTSRLAAIAGSQVDEGNCSNMYIKGEEFDVRIDAEPVDKYLLNSAFAGDGVAVHVVSGRLLTIPEYLTANPTEQIRDAKSVGLPRNPMLDDNEVALGWKLNHREKLAGFEKAATEMAAKLPTRDNR